jgi:hypothetical protein
MYTSRTGLILGFHGTDESIVNNIPTGSSEVEESEKMDKLHSEYMQSACQESKPMVDGFLQTFNQKIYDFSTEWVSRMKYFTNEIVYYLRYSSPTEEDYQRSKNLYQTVFLACIAGNAPFVTTPVDFQFGCNSCNDIIRISGICEDAPEKYKNPYHPLPDFDMIHCDNHIVLKAPGIGETRWDCNILQYKNS